ncbi:WXG100 family type VII secretion target [Bifidobacterium catulorum]|uniref:ESAT-6-like protein n=1 Tax=Bifidobacterium catulorum TaxID=1630173 RepID=A0A2U2MR10_9BIFI|nr:WXG100 family type VII secretion target [Bifidobacterium catulorum]PWG59280.1 WXG100 family type VII secretion target [Bifidobacterium catulorum]
MAGVISVTPEKLQSQTKVYIDAQQGIEQQIQRVNKMNAVIHEEWKGAAFEAYLHQYEQLYGEVQKFEQLLGSIHQQLNQYASTVAERDPEDARSFGLN